MPMFSLARRLSRRSILSGSLMFAGAIVAACAAPAPTATPVPAKPAEAPKPAAPAPAAPAPAATKPAAAAPTNTPAPALAAAAPTIVPAVAAKPAGGAKPKITYLHLDDPTLKAIRKSIVEDYNKANMEATVEEIIVAHDQLETKRNAFIAAGTPPDVFVGQGGSQNIAALKEILLNLDPYIARDKDRAQIDQYYDVPFQYVKYQGKTLQWPCIAIARVLGYNRELFDAAGLKYPTNDWTYDDLVSAAKTLTKKGSDGKPVQWGVTTDRRSFIEWMNGIWARGGTVFTDDLKKIRLDEKFGIDTFQWMYDKVHKVGISPGPGQDLEGNFASGKYGMDWGAHVYGWPAWRKADLKWDIVMLPKGPVARGPRIVMDTWSLTAASKFPDGAWDFLMFATSPPQAAKFAEKGYTPPRKDVAKMTWLKDLPDKRTVDPKNLEAYFETMQHVKHVQHSKHFLKISFDIVAPQLDLMFEKKKSPEQAAVDAAKETNEFLASQTDW